SAKRVTPFAKMLGLDFVSNGKKPLSVGIKKCRERLNAEKNQMAVVGDQIFTDILCGKWYKIKSILVEPIQMEKNVFFKAKRWAEKGILKKYKGERKF
ncbi:MAG: HAD hydrolase-like protein, partial [Oscillospiraceae bacterium]